VADHLTEYSQARENRRAISIFFMQKITEDIHVYIETTNNN